jgi:predicted XRE-type DNA-binding protein
LLSCQQAEQSRKETAMTDLTYDIQQLLDSAPKLFGVFDDTTAAQFAASFTKPKGSKRPSLESSPIVVSMTTPNHPAILIDGYERLRLLAKAGETTLAASEVVVARHVTTPEAAELESISRNVNRRRPSAEQMGALAKKLQTERKMNQTAIARVFGVSQPAVSKALAKFEQAEAELAARQLREHERAAAVERLQAQPSGEKPQPETPVAGGNPEAMGVQQRAEQQQPEQQPAGPEATEQPVAQVPEPVEQQQQPQIPERLMRIIKAAGANAWKLIDAVGQLEYSGEQSEDPAGQLRDLLRETSAQLENLANLISEPAPAEN